MLSASVEAEVFEAVGLPNKIRVLDPKRDENELGHNEKARYANLTKTIYIAVQHATPTRIAHEVGHHIEEQGPVEIWSALASYLQRLSAGRPLNAATAESAGNVTYGVDNNFPALPQPVYALSYYLDAGTELLAVALEEQITDDLTDYWRPDIPGPRYDPVLVLLVLHASRPRQLREAGIRYPTLYE